MTTLIAARPKRDYSPMPPALILLLKLQFRGVLRSARRRARGAKGAAFAIIGVVIFVVWLGPAIATGAIMPRSDPAKVRLIVPWAILLATVLSTFSGAGDKAIAFSQLDESSARAFPEICCL